MLRIIKNNLPETLWFLFFVVYAAALNSQLLDASNIHVRIAGHDEYLTVRQVYSILEPASWKHFVMAVISGEKLYYGRVMFYVDALLAYIPYKIWGVDGMILAIRMTHAVVLAFGLLILAQTFINSKGYKLLFLIFCGLGFYSNYFIMMPKPEPFQLLFLALFLKYWKQADWKFGKSFFWLGMAYGAKFNILFALPIIGLICLIPSLQPWTDKLKTIGKNKIRPFLLSIVWFFGGLIVAIPCLILIPAKPIVLQTYINHTFLGSGQIDDDPSVTWFQWLFNSYSFYFWGINWGAVVFLILVGTVAFVIFKHWRKTKRVTDEFPILLISLSLFVPVILLTKRLWPHYLWTAHILFVLLFFMFMQNILLEKKLKLVFNFAVVASLLLVSISFLTSHLSNYFGLNETYAKEESEWNKARTYILSKNKSARIVQEMKVYYPFTEFVKINPYHPFVGSLPINTLHSSVSWAIPEHPGNKEEIKEMDYLIVLNSTIWNAKDKTINNQNNSPALAESNNKWRNELNQSIGSVWQKDTVMYGLTILKKPKP